MLLIVIIMFTVQHWLIAKVSQNKTKPVIQKWVIILVCITSTACEIKSRNEFSQHCFRSLLRYQKLWLLQFSLTMWWLHHGLLQLQKQQPSHLNYFAPPGTAKLNRNYTRSFVRNESAAINHDRIMFSLRVLYIIHDPKGVLYTKLSVMLCVMKTRRVYL